MFDNTYVPVEPSAPQKDVLDFTPNPEGQSTDVLDFSNQKPVPFTGLSLETTDNRASKAHFAMQDQSPGLEMLKAKFASDGEWDTRQQMATNQDIQNQYRAMDMTRKVAAVSGPLSPEDVNFTMNVVKAKPVDPSTVLETEFAKNFTHMGMTVRPDINNVFSKGWMYFPGATAFEQYLATDLQTKKQIAVSKLEELENRWQKTSWFGGGSSTPSVGDVLSGPSKADGALDAYALSLIPFMSWTNQHNGLAKAEGLFPGTNMANQTRALWNLNSTEEFARTHSAALEEMWKRNPLDALVAARAAVSFSDSDELLGNVFGWADIASVIPVGALIKGGRYLSTFSKNKLTSELPRGAGEASKSVAPGQFNPYSFEPGRVGPASDLLPQEVRDAGREIAGRPPEGPVMNAKRGQTFDINRGPTMQVEKGPSVEVPPSEMGPISAQVRDMNLRLSGPTSDSRLPPLEGDVTRQQFIQSWERYYRDRPWAAPSDVNPDGSFPAALLPRTPNAPRSATPDRYEEMMHGVRQALGDSIKASGTTRVEPEVTFNYFGDIENAAKIGINRINQNAAELDKTGQITKQSADTQGLNEFGKDLPSSFNPIGLSKNLVNMSRARAQGLADRLEAQGESFKTLLSNSMGVERRPEEALQQAYKATADDFRFEFHTNEDHILDIVQNGRDPFTNTRSSTVMFGNRGKLPFETKEQAETFARDILQVNPERYTVEARQQGVGYTVNITKPLNEFDSSVRDLKIETAHANIPINRWSNLIFGTWNPKSAEDLLSRFIQEGAHTATHSPQNLRAMFKGIIDENINSLSKTQRTEVQDVLRANRDYQEKGKRGIFAESIGDFEIQFRDIHGKPPSDKQTDAYFSFIQLNDMDWVLRNLGVLRDKQIKGIEQHRFLLGEGKTPWMEGRFMREYPSGISEDSGLMIFTDGKPGEYIRRHDAAWDTNKINKLMEEGHSLIQLAEPHTRPLMPLTGEKDVINYVLTNTKDTQALPWKQMEYQPGGHVVYANNWWVKQPQIAVGRQGNSFYYGDVNLFNFSSEKEAKMWAGRYEEARKLLNADDEAALDAYVTKNLPHSPAELKELFKTHLDPAQQIMHTESGRNTVKTNPDHFFEAYKDRGGLRNDVDSQFNMYQGMDKTFLADRDYQLGTVAGDGSVLKPWKIEAAKAVEPYNALNQALGQAMRARYMQDYKIAASESWLRQFGYLLQGAEREAFRRNPLSALYNANAKSLAANASREETLAALNAKDRIIDFIGTKTEYDRNMNRIQNLVADFAYTRGGHDVADMVSEKILPWITSPVEYARAIAFHTHLGMFNPVQLWVQGITMANSIAIAGPVNGSLGAVLGTMQHYLGQTAQRNIIEDFANKASKVTLGKVTPEQFLEAYDFMKASGIEHVGGETAWRDSVMDPKLFFGQAGKWLDKGTLFFNMGERQTRLTAFNTAFLEWRLANKDAELTNQVKNQILTRSDTLSGNMTRASNANWQTGILSPALQFQAYATRMAEQMLPGMSSRLSGTEKLRAFATYSTLFGIPVGLGASTGLDWYTDMRKAALERGVDLSDPFIKAFSEGLIPNAVSVALGKDYDTAKRFNYGTSFWQDLWQGVNNKGGAKKSLDEIIGGASWQTIKDIAGTMKPFGHWAYNAVVTGDPKAFPIVAEDFVSLADNSSTTWSNTMKMMYGLYAGQYITKNNVKVDGISKLDSVLMPVFGIKPMTIENTFEKAEVNKERKEAQEKFEQLALTSYRRAMDRAYKFNDMDGMKELMKQSHMYLEAGQLNETQKATFWERANKGEAMTMRQKIDLDWIKNAPSWAYPDRVKKGIGN